MHTLSASWSIYETYARPSVRNITAWPRSSITYYAQCRTRMCTGLIRS
jgi:hypothetical protein